MIKSKAYLGNQPSSILIDAATEIIATLKDQNLRDPDRHDTISRILTGKGTSAPNSLSKEQFSVFVNIGKGLKDYEDYTKGTTDGKEDDQLDDEMGVAVVFDSDEEGDENNLNDDASERDEDEVVEVASTSSSEPEEEDENGPDDENNDD